VLPNLAVQLYSLDRSAAGGARARHWRWILKERQERRGPKVPCFRSGRRWS